MLEELEEPEEPEEEGPVLLSGYPEEPAEEPEVPVDNPEEPGSCVDVCGLELDEVTGPLGGTQV